MFLDKGLRMYLVLLYTNDVGFRLEKLVLTRIAANSEKKRAYG